MDDTTESQSRGRVVAFVALAILAASLLPAEATFHLALIAVSTVMAASIALAAVIALTGRSLW